MSQVIVPKENSAIYGFLYNIEVGLRELIIEVFESTGNPKCWKQRLPPDIYDCYRAGRDYERKIKWCELLPHHPIYYIEFPHLRIIIEQANNWRDFFQPIFKQKDLFSVAFAELEPIRNKVAHNRKATVRDVSIVKEVFKKVVTVVGERHFSELVSRCTSASDIREALNRLQAEAESAFSLCNACKPVSELRVWEMVQMKWWFDEDYLGCKLEAIEALFKTLDAYSKLPRLRGSGHHIEAWTKSQNVVEKYEKAIEQFSILSSVV